MGDSKGALQQAEAGLVQEDSPGTQPRRVGALWSCEDLFRLKGEWSEARAFSNQGLELAPREPRLLFSRTLMEYEVGNFNEAEAYLNRLLDAMNLTPPGPTLEYVFSNLAIALTTRTTGTLNRLEIAKKAGETVLLSPFGTPFVTTVARAGLALIAMQDDDVQAIEEQIEALHTGRGSRHTWNSW